MVEQPKVSIITPVYNGCSYIGRFIKSLLAQTYENVQVIIINDGSTDGTHEIIENYKENIERKMKEFLYITIPNGGAGYAVNYALKYVKGEYLTWADSDDELLPTNLEKKVEFLDDNPEYGMVHCGAKAIDQNSNSELYDLIIPKEARKDNMFHEIIKGIPCYPGVFMIRTNLLFNTLTNKEIYYNPEVGQNYQLLLPVAYCSKCGFLDDILYLYYVRMDSHSRNSSFRQNFERTYTREEALENILTFLPKEIYSLEISNIKKESIIRRFNMAHDERNADYLKRAYKELKSNNLKNVYYMKVYLSDVYPIFKMLRHIKFRFFNMLEKCFIWRGR